MYIASAAPAALSASQPTASDAGNALATLQGLASVILDTSGSASDADKLDARACAARANTVLLSG